MAEDLTGPTPQDYIHQALTASYGEPEDAFRLLMTQRAHEPQNPALRDAEHALFSHTIISQHGLMGALVLALATPAYSGMKWGMNQLPPQLARTLNPAVPYSPYGQASSPSWNEVKWGLAPFWGGIPDLIPYRAQVP